MGIRDLTPFLVKNFPNVVKQLPNRFQPFSGKKIAIDATLITQRLWFGQDPHPYRHVLGWYRLITELKTAGVGAICVFDGAGQTVAKREERKRRAKERALVAQRAELEKDRKNRLNSFTTILENFQQLSPTQKVQVPQVIKELSVNSWKLSEVQAPASETAQEPPEAGPAEVTSDDTYVAKRLEDVLSPDELRSWRRRKAAAYRSSLRSCRQGHLTPVALEQVLVPSVDDISSVMEKLSLTTTDSEEAMKRQAEDVMSKTQAKLASDEGAVWRDLNESFDQTDAGTAELDGSLEAATERLRMLASSSEQYWQAYHKRTLVPTMWTYEECRSLIDAMGIPVIDAPDPFEAEAVAASLCVNGFADAVGSEDTDVLIYEAPLLRNLTSVNQPLLHISGADVRESLNLSRESYVDFALLLGSDFSPRLYGLGPSRAIKLIQAEKCIEAVLASERKKERCPRFLPEPHLTEEAYLEQIGFGREVFMNLPPITEDLKVQILGEIEPDRAALIDILQTFDVQGDVWKSDDRTNPLKGDFPGNVEDEFEAPDLYFFQ